MQQHAMDKRDGAHRAGRWCTRALMVLGGAVAGTAAAWALSTSPASASVENAADPADPVVHSTPEPAGDMFGHFTGDLAPAAETTPATADTTNAAEQASGNAVHADGAGSASQREDRPVRDAIDDARNAVHKPVEGTVRTLAHVLTEPEDAPQTMRDALRPPERWQEFGEQVWEYFQPKAPGDLIPQPSLPTGSDQQIDAPSSAQPDVAAVLSDAENPQPPPNDDVTPHGASTDAAGTWSAWSADNGHSAAAVDHGRSDLPAAPLRLPLVPVSSPHAPGTGGGHVDSLQLGLPTGGPAAFDPSVAAAVRSGVQHLLLRPQPQPGLSPD